MNAIKFRHLNVFTFLMIFSLFLLGCSNDNNGESNTIEQNGGNVYYYQAVSIDVPNIDLNENEYDATFGGIDIKVVKTDLHQLVFGVPVEAALGNTELIIPSLGNAKIRYNVLQPELEQAADETVADLFTLADTYFSSLEVLGPEDTEALGAFEQFHTYYESLSDEDKLTVALYYQVNKQAIDNVILFDGTSQEGRLSAGDIIVIAKFCFAAVVTVGGGISVVYGEASLKLLGVVLTKVGYSKAVKFHDELKQRSIKTIGLSANGIIGAEGRGTLDNEIVLMDNVAAAIPFQLVERPLTQNDSGIDNSDIERFFSGQSLYNNFLQKVNSVIEWVNANTWFTFSTFQMAVLSSNPVQTTTDVTASAMQDISFSIDDPNLELVHASLESNGQLNLKVKFVGNPTGTDVISTLNYSYSDEISSFSGSFPIKVSQESDFYATVVFDGTPYVIDYTGDNFYVNDYPYGYGCTNGTLDGSPKYNIVFDNPEIGVNVANVFSAADTTQPVIDPILDSSGECTAFIQVTLTEDLDAQWETLNGTLTKTGANSFTFTCVMYKRNPLDSSDQSVTVNMSGEVTFGE